MNICFANIANIATIALAACAFLAAIYAARNLWAIKKKYRYDILVSLTDQINNRDERRNRAIIHSAWARSNWNDIDGGDKIISLFEDGWETEKSRKQIELENQFRVQWLYKLLINSWVIRQLRKGIAPNQIKKAFITHCQRAKVSFSETKQMFSYLRSNLTKK